MTRYRTRPAPSGGRCLFVDMWCRNLRQANDFVGLRPETLRADEPFPQRPLTPETTQERGEEIKVINKVMLVGVVSSVPRYYEAPEGSAEVDTLIFDVDTGDSHIHHCELREFLARSTHEDFGPERGDLVFVLGRIESHDLIDNDFEYRGRYVYVIGQDFTLLTNWARHELEKKKAIN